MNPRQCFASAASVAVLGVVLGVQPTMAAAPKALEQVVRYADLDLGTDAGVLALYARLERAARRVCPVRELRDLNQVRAARDCRAAALANAVAGIGHERLASIHERRVARGSPG